MKSTKEFTRNELNHFFSRLALRAAGGDLGFAQKIQAEILSGRAIESRAEGLYVIMIRAQVRAHNAAGTNESNEKELVRRSHRIIRAIAQKIEQHADTDEAEALANYINGVADRFEKGDCARVAESLTQIFITDGETCELAISMVEDMAAEIGAELKSPWTSPDGLRIIPA